MEPIFANIVVETFIKGGTIMWPILFCLLIAVTVVVERGLWWFRLFRIHSKENLEAVFFAIAEGGFKEAYEETFRTEDPHMMTIRSGLEHAHTSLLGAMQLRASEILEEAEKRLWVLGTFITLSPLLGLMGTVVGIMHSFSFIGDEALAATKVSGGIGEALIATACGLGIAILCLIPYNYFNRLLALLRGRLERTINHVELLVESAKHHGYELEDFSKQHARRPKRRLRPSQVNESTVSQPAKV